MTETVNYQCPSCGGPLHFVGSTGKVQCDYCDSSFTVEEVEAYYAAKQNKAEAKAAQAQQKEDAKAAKQAQAEGKPVEKKGDKVVAEGKKKAAAAAAAGLDPIQAYLQRASWADEEASNMSSSICSSCGAQLMHDVTTAVTQCPYCGNNSVIPGTMGDTLKPDYIIPFKLGKEDAVQALKEYYKGKKFLPKAFANENHLEEVQGVYVPFWLYSARTEAQGSFSAQNVMTWREGKYQVTKTDFYELERAGHMEFQLVPVDGSQKMPDAHMDAIEPFDYREIKPFSVAYLPGYLTDRYDLSIADCQPRAYNRMASSSEQALRETAEGYTTVESRGCSVDAKWKEVAYALLPVWMLHTRWEGKDFLFAMNGQTGKLIGDLPVQKSKVAAWFLGIGIPLAAVFSAIAMFL